MGLVGQSSCPVGGMARTQVAIVGIDDYLLSVGAIKKYVSGVDTNLEEQGYRGAELLDRLMRGEQPAAHCIDVGFELVMRDST